MTDLLPLILSAAALVMGAAALVLGHFANQNRRKQIGELEVDVSQAMRQAQWALETGKNRQPPRSGGAKNAARSAQTDWTQWSDGVNKHLSRLDKEHAALKRHFDEYVATAQSGGADGAGKGERPTAPPATHRPLSPAERGLVEAYNAAATGDRGAFTGRYATERIDVANAPDLARDPSTAPQFEASRSGDYLGVRLDGLGSGEVAVVPKLGLTYGEELHQRAGMRRVFSSDGYEPDLHYRDVRLVAPAHFRGGGDGTYVLVRPGAIDLGRGE